MSSISNRFKQIREDKGLSVTAIAALLDENRQRIVDIESGKQRIPEDVIIKCIEKFFIDANWLMTGEGNMYRYQSNVQPNRKMAAMQKLMESLSERQQEEILSVIEEKERLNRLEKQFSEIAARLSA